ncbi:NADH-quinone oxidoreductase subunit C [Streptomyces caeruleatus]|uniref:Dehydrogenase n=1 Tax=Streptomyces caeruleatus TaxID=661399 RepID=A0A101TJW0_9ACTN|nr:NADH-quinone oxidoreductase subunit C [Streptomyces caeruleatus]KUN93696.1 dehydrogenase [Streptomyces caeruleatus]
MTTTGWLPAPVEDLFGPEATAEESYDVLTVDVPPASWIAALKTARDELGCTYFDWLSAVDEPGTGFRVAAHVAALSPVRRLLVRTTVPHEAPTLPTAIGVYAGAAWHERETHEMFGVLFADHPALDHLLLPDNFEGHPLRKDFVLAARVAKAWPGAKEPGESEHGGSKRRQMLPPGVPDPNEWGPLKGQLPPAPARPARGAGRAAAERPARPAGDRPVRRTRTAAEGSASQPDPSTPAVAPTTGAAGTPRRTRTAAEGSASQQATVPSAEGSPDQPTAAQAAEPSPETPARPTGTSTPTSPRRSRTAGEGSASQRPETSTDATTEGTEAGQQPSAPTAPPTRRARSAGEGSASQRPGTGTAPSGVRRSRSASDGSASQQPAPEAASPDTAPSPPPTPKAPRSPDAPWHHARPAFDEPEAQQPASAPEQPASTSEQSTSAPDQPSRPDQPAQPEPDETKATPAENGNPADPDDPANSADDRTDPAGGPQ